jgi:FSR family fosmidomycin resistance protein-like MFS transporter
MTTLSQTAPLQTTPWRQDARVIALVGMAHAISHFSHLLLAPLFPVFMRDFHLTYSQVGLLMSVFFVVSGVGQALSGFVVDRIGARPVLFGALGCFGLAAVAASMATGYGGLLVVALLAGVGNAPFHPADFTILNQRVSAARLGHAFSVHGLTGNLGWALAPVFLVGVSAMANWRVAYVCAAGLYALVALVLFLNRDVLVTHTVPRPAQRGRWDDVQFLRKPVVWWCFAFFFFSAMTLAVIQSYSPSILKGMHQTSFEVATVTLTAYMLCGAAGMAVGGFVAARAAQPDRVVAWTLAAGVGLLLWCATGALGPQGTPIALAITGFAVGMAGPSRDLMIKRATPQGATGRVYGLVYCGLDLGFALSPVLFGLLMDQHLYAAALTGAAGVLALSALAAVGVGARTPG